MAKFDFKKLILKDLDDQPIFPQKVENGLLVNDTSLLVRTIADIIAQNLVSEDQKATPEKRFEYFQLALKIKAGKGEVDYSIEEMAMIKEKAGANPMPVVVGRIWEVIEPKK